MPSRVIGFNCIRSLSLSLSPTVDLHELADRIEELVDHALLERNDRVVGDRDVLRTHLGAAFRDVAIPNPVRLLERRYTIFRIQRMHLERSSIHEESRSYKLLMLLVIA